MDHKNAYTDSAEMLPVYHTANSAVISRDEMNLAEFPLSVLSTRVDTKLKTLEFRDIIAGKNGKPVTREWIITAADKFGLPTASDDEVLLGLLKLTVDDGFKSQRVFFTRYELLQILGWATEGRSYTRIQKSLDRLTGVRIKATNAFYDNESKSHSTKNFGIIDAYEINDGRDIAVKKSFFIWSAEIFKSFQAGFIKKLDLEFFQKLSSAIAKRLYRYLDKNFWYRSRLTINLFTLAHEKIGISRNYQYASSIRQQLDPALDELIAAGFIASYEYNGKGKGTEIIIAASSSKPRCHGTDNKVANISSHAKVRQPEKAVREPEARLSRAAAISGEIRDKLVERGLALKQAEKISAESSMTRLERIDAIITHFDGLMRSAHGAGIKSPVGFLYRAVSDPEKFVLPSDVNNSANIAAKSEQVRASKGAIADKKMEVSAQRQALQEQYFIDREAEIDRLMNNIEPNLLNRVESEVILSLNKLVGVLSQDRLQQSIVHGVRQKVAQLFALPSFEEWKKAR